MSSLAASLTLNPEPNENKVKRTNPRGDRETLSQLCKKDPSTSALITRKKDGSSHIVFHTAA